jgi:hypothetical protein
MVAELYDALRKAGVDENLSKEAAMAVLPADAITQLATKADLADLRLTTKADLAELKGEMKADMAALRGDFVAFRAEQRADLAELRVELIKWNVGAMAVLTAIFAAISRFG